MAVSSKRPTDDIGAEKAALQRFITESFTLLGLGVLITALRTYARVKAVGFRKLWFDDLLAWVAIIFVTAETIIAYVLGCVLRGLGNSNMTPDQRVALDPSSDEYRMRTLGSQLPLAAWTTYLTALWCLKGSLLIFYTRLTARLGRGYAIRLYIGTALIAMSYLAVILHLFLSCRPFHRFWQLNPDPGNLCYATLSSQVASVVLSFNVLTDTYLLSIPLPMLWKVRMRVLKKCGLILLFSGGIVVITFASLRCTAIITDPQHGGQVAGLWAIRETFAAVVTSNFPIIFPLINHWLWPLIGVCITSTRYDNNHSDKAGDSELVTFGRAIGAGRCNESSEQPGANKLWNTIGSESEERITQPAEALDHIAELTKHAPA